MAEYCDGFVCAREKSQDKLSVCVDASRCHQALYLVCLWYLQWILNSWEHISALSSIIVIVIIIITIIIIIHHHHFHVHYHIIFRIIIAICSLSPVITIIITHHHCHPSSASLLSRVGAAVCAVKRQNQHCSGVFWLTVLYPFHRCFSRLFERDRNGWSLQLHAH